SGIWPAVNTRFPSLIACEYGPIAPGALSVLMISPGIVSLHLPLEVSVCEIGPRALPRRTLSSIADRRRSTALTFVLCPSACRSVTLDWRNAMCAQGRGIGLAA